MKRLTGNRIIDILREQEHTLKRYHVKRIGLFGSYAHGTPTPKSDIDLLVEFERPSFDDFMDLAASLEKLFGKKVDLLTPIGLKSIRVKGVARRITQHLRYVWEE